VFTQPKQPVISSYTQRSGNPAEAKKASLDTTGRRRFGWLYFLPMAAHDHKEGSDLSEMELRVRALETILVEKGYIETAALDRIVELYATKIGPHIDAQVIAKAWSDPSFRQSLLEDATKAVSTLAQVGREATRSLRWHRAHEST